MPYGFGGVDFTLQPTEGNWVERPMLGRTGDGHFVYPTTREFEMRWGLMTPAQVDEVLTYFENLTFTGTLVVSLPKWSATTYVFENYTGCTISEPTVKRYFAEHLTDIYLLVSQIRTV